MIRRLLRLPFAPLRALWLPRVLVPASLVLIAACDRSAGHGQALAAPTQKPNILLIIWDTVRADRFGLYGYDRATTPNIDVWAREARVFDNCVSAGSNTIPGHASIFSGLLPTEHGADNESKWLSGDLDTLAELLKAAGYGTYLFAENPHIAVETNVAQGFDLVEHPWINKYKREAIEITLRKLSDLDRTSQLARKVKTTRGANAWNIKACGELAQKGIEDWLPTKDPDHPFFICLNYMEAHRPLIPEIQYRRRMMSEEEVRISYNIDRRWITLWSYVYGLHDYTEREMDVTRKTYDAALLELDDMFHKLLESLRARGQLDNTVVVLTSDHGEHLGEHHMLDHQFSVYDPVLRVPLVIHDPAHFAAGRDPRPVSNMDLFPTLLELAGIEPPVRSKAVSLLRPLEKRVLMGEYPVVMTGASRSVGARYPGFDLSPWNRTLRAYYDPPFKFIEASNQRHELYNLADDPGELTNLIEQEPMIAHRLAGDVRAFVASLRKPPGPPAGPRPAVSGDTQRRLEALGYAGGSEGEEEGEAEEDDVAPTSKPASRPASRPSSQRPASPPRTP